MTAHAFDHVDERLRRAWQEHTRAPKDCPSAAELWEFADYPQATPAVLKHVVDCTACSQAVRARYRLEPPGRSDGVDAPRWRGLAAALALAAVGLVALRPQIAADSFTEGQVVGEPTSVRGQHGGLAPKNPQTIKPSGEVTLQWSSTGNEQTFDVQVFDAQLNPVVNTTGITEQSLTLAPGKLDAFIGKTLYWQVVVHEVDGRRRVGPTWELRFEP